MRSSNRAKSNKPRTNKVARIRRRSSVGQIVMSLLSVLVLFLAAFTALEVPVATQRNLVSFATNKLVLAASYLPPQASTKVRSIWPDLKLDAPQYRSTLYCPLAPAAVFVGYVLGPILGLIACASFLLLGLLGPLVNIHAFASGGGLAYVHEPGFGYLLALLPTAWLAGMITRGRRTTMSQCLAVFAGLSVTHLSGLMFLFGSVLISYMVNGNSAALAWQPWVFELARNMTWYPLPYDILSALALIGLGFPFRWLANALSSPDSNASTRNGAGAMPNAASSGDFVSIDAFSEESLELV